MKLDLSGDFEVQASPAAAYAFLMDPHRLAPLLPMFKELSAVHEEGFTVVLEMGVPQVRGRVEAVVKRLDCIQDQRARFDCRGRHALGMADTLLAFELTPRGTGSCIRWECQSIVRGTLASLANGVLAPLAKRNVASMIEVLKAELGPREPVPAPSAAPAAAHTGQTPARTQGLGHKLFNWLRSIFGRA
jgi:carbon monoxide dehydrogenase subunit G